jgi:hypothetical protein
MTPELERANHRLRVARAELNRFQSMSLGCESPADVAMLKRLERSVTIAMSDVAWAERIAHG